MERAIYCVVENGGVWSVRLNDRHANPCRSKDQALDMALRAAERQHLSGIDSHVMIRERGRFRTIWCGDDEVRAQAA